MGHYIKTPNTNCVKKGNIRSCQNNLAALDKKYIIIKECVIYIKYTTKNKIKNKNKFIKIRDMQNFYTTKNNI